MNFSIFCARLKRPWFGIKLAVSLLIILALGGCEPSMDQEVNSQLNLGQLIDAEGNKRGEGFELRTDDWGAIRAGKGLLISTVSQPSGQGAALEMKAALTQLNQALELVTALAQNAAVSGALYPDLESQKHLREALTSLDKSGLIVSAPAGIAFTTPASIQLSAAHTLTATAGESVDFGVFKSFSVAAGEAVSLFAQKHGMKLIASRGKVDIQAQSDAMTVQADKKLELYSINDEIMIGATQGITLYSGSAYIKLKDGSIEIGAPGEIRVRKGELASREKALAPEEPLDTNFMSGRFQVRDKFDNKPKPYVPYRIEAEDGSVVRGVTDAEGYTKRHSSSEEQELKLFFE